jgi:hypothetical protein
LGKNGKKKSAKISIPQMKLEASFTWTGDTSVLNGDWFIADGLSPLTLKVDGTKITSVQKIYGGEGLNCTVEGSGRNLLIRGKFGPFFEVAGRVEDGMISWNNGAKWVKMG